VHTHPYCLCVHDRWEAIAALETLFYGLHDSYHTLSEAAGPQGCIPMSDAISEKCKLASEEHHKFLGAHYVDENGYSSKAKLLSFLETDSIPVREQSMYSSVSMPSVLCLNVASLSRMQYQLNMLSVHAAGGSSVLLSQLCFVPAHYCRQ